MKGKGQQLPRGGALVTLVTAPLLFVAVLAAAAALALAGAARTMEGSGRLMVQVMAPDPHRREAEAAQVVRLLAHAPGVTAPRWVSEAEMQDMLSPWLGAGASDLPIPILIEAELADSAVPLRLEPAILRVAPSAVVNAQDQWLGPVRRLAGLLQWLAAGLVLVVAATLAGMAALAARAGLAAHRETLGIMHLLGATDRQLARLFERRTALDALWGGLIGWAAAMPMLLLVADRAAALGAVGVSPLLALTLLILPLGCALLAMLVARVTLLRALRADR